jgi:hypothetical protein
VQPGRRAASRQSAPAPRRAAPAHPPAVPGDGCFPPRTPAARPAGTRCLRVPREEGKDPDRRGERSERPGCGTQLARGMLTSRDSAPGCRRRPGPAGEPATQIRLPVMPIRFALSRQQHRAASRHRGVAGLARFPALAVVADFPQRLRPAACPQIRLVSSEINRNPQTAGIVKLDIHRRLRFIPVALHRRSAIAFRTCQAA